MPIPYTEKNGTVVNIEGDYLVRYKPNGDISKSLFRNSEGKILKCTWKFRDRVFGMCRFCDVSNPRCWAYIPRDAYDIRNKMKNKGKIKLKGT